MESRRWTLTHLGAVLKYLPQKEISAEDASLDILCVAGVHCALHFLDQDSHEKRDPRQQLSSHSDKRWQPERESSHGEKIVIVV